MSTPWFARLLTRSARQSVCIRPPTAQLTIRRAASTKHPKGFVPPTWEDLTELRERVQEFTSEALNYEKFGPVF